MDLPRRNFLQGLFALGLTSSLLASCSGPFKVIRLNNAQPYGHYDSFLSQKEISAITLAHLNAADLRGNTPNIFAVISEEEARERAKWLADFLRKEGADIISLNEVDYAGTAKTGSLDQPKIIAEYLGAPYNYVLFDQYMKSPLWTTGNAVISRYPLQEVYRLPYGSNDCSLDSNFGHFFKDLIHVKAKIGKKEAQIIVTHLDDEGGAYSFRRKEEAQELREYIRDYHRRNPESYVILAGDLNDGHDSPIMKMLLADKILYPPGKNFGLKTYQNENLYHDIDHILASSNIKIDNYRTFQFPWSDHLGLICRLEFL